MIKDEISDLVHDGLVIQCQSLLSHRLAGSCPLVPVEMLPSVGGFMLHFHRMRIGQWLCKLKLTGLCIVLEVRTEERGRAAFAMLGETTHILSVGDTRSSLAVVKGTRAPSIQLGDNVAEAAEIAYQYGIRVGHHGSQDHGAFYDSPAFLAMILALETSRIPISPVFSKPYKELGDWYAVAKQRLAERQLACGPA